MSEEGCAYTVGTGRLFASWREFQAYAEQLTGRPILTHEFGFAETWQELRDALEEKLLLEAGI